MTWRSAVMLVAITPAVGTALVLAVRDLERRAGIYLALFLLAGSISATPQIIGFANFYDRWPDLTFLPVSLELLLPGLLFLHAAALTGAEVRRPWLWLAPGIAQVSYYTVLFVAFENHLAKWAYSKAIHGPYIGVIEVVFAVGFSIYALVRVRRDQTAYATFLEQTVSVDDVFDPVWIRRLPQMFVALTVVWGSVALIDAFITPLAYVTAYPFHVVAGFILSATGLQALSGIRESFPKPSSTTDESQRPAETDPTVEDWSERGAALAKSLIERRWYAEPRLSIRDVSRRLATNETYVSRALNQGLGVSFRAFVNRLRVDDAKTALCEGDEPVLEIGLRVGFSSKATFNRVFREQVGETPTQFRRSQNAKKTAADAN